MCRSAAASGMLAVIGWYIVSYNRRARAAALIVAFLGLTIVNVLNWKFHQCEWSHPYA